jgi:uncharacterized membrane protein SirB2
MRKCNSNISIKSRPHYHCYILIATQALASKSHRSSHRTFAFMATEENALVWLFTTMPLVVASNPLK